MIKKILNYKWEVISTIVIILLIKYFFGFMFHLDEFTLEDSRVSKAVVNEVGEKLGLQCIGLGGSAPQNKLNYISFRFLSHEKTNISQAREQLLEIANIYLKQINSNEMIRKYMVTYPFDIKNCDITIFYQDFNFKAHQHPFLSAASIDLGTFSYYTKDSQKREFGYESETEESYEEALKNSKDPSLKEHDK